MLPKQNSNSVGGIHNTESVLDYYCVKHPLVLLAETEK